MVSDRDGQLLLKVELGANTATHKEAGWYEHLVEMGLGESPLYLGSVRADKFALLALRYIDDAITLDEWAEENATKKDEFGDLVLSMLHYDERLFSKTAAIVPKDAIEQFLVDKYRARRKEAAEIQYLNDLLTGHQIVINGQDYLTPDHAMKKLLDSKALREQLIPESIGFIHGDLHTGNALIKDEILYYVDPNGGLEIPLEYDLAKILHSVHGQYPIIMRGEFAISKDRQGNYEFNLGEKPIYSTAHQKLKDALGHEQYLRSVFIEAMHFATMLPHHAQNQLETTALFLRSTQLFGELFALLDRTTVTSKVLKRAQQRTILH